MRSCRRATTGTAGDASRQRAVAAATLLIACGALAREVLALIELNGWRTCDVTCLPAKLHNPPERIPEAVRAKIRAGRASNERILVVYGDCGTGGSSTACSAEEGVERIRGPHCYAFYRGLATFLEEADADPTCFYLTDYLVRHFERLIIKGLGLDRHPELLPLYFGNYTKLVYLAQTSDPALERRPRRLRCGSVSPSSTRRPATASSPIPAPAG